MRFVPRGERLRFARFEQWRNNKCSDRQTPGVHRAQCMSANKFQSMPLNHVLWRAQHDHRTREVCIQQREQPILIAATRARGSDKLARDLDSCPRLRDGRNVWVSQ